MLYRAPRTLAARQAVFRPMVAWGGGFRGVAPLGTGAQEPLLDTLFCLAAANWSVWHLSFLPSYVEAHLLFAGPSERQALTALFGASDLDAATFERQALAFLSDAAFYERYAAQ